MMIVMEYTKEFYKVNLRARYVEYTPKKTTRFVNGPRMEILDEISIVSPKTIEEAYQSALKVEEKITKKQNARRGSVLVEEEDSPLVEVGLPIVMRKVIV